jgi:hypothetical protein
MAKRKKAEAKSNAKGLSLHAGLNGVSAAAYGGWDGRSRLASSTPTTWPAIAKSAGMKSTILLTKKATRANVLSGMRDAAKALKAGDFFLLTYSGTVDRSRT